MAFTVNVEEYKRPKFKVEVEVPKEAFKLNDTVKVPGKATQYNGVPVGGAKVRTASPARCATRTGSSSTAGGGRSRTGPLRRSPAGSFRPNPTARSSIPFQALPDLTVTRKDEPTFRYTITADVTDTTGETRTGTKSVQVGYVALRATIKCRRLAHGRQASEVRPEHHDARRRGSGREGHAQGLSPEAARKAGPRAISSALHYWFPRLKADETPKPDPAQAD